MTFTPEQINKAKTAKSADELIALAKENGIEMTEDEAKAYFGELNKQGELNDNELDSVAGGKGDPHDEYPSGTCFYSVSDHKCPICGEEMTYTGNAFFGKKNHDVYLCGNSGNSFMLDYSGPEIKSFWTKLD